MLYCLYHNNLVPSQSEPQNPFLPNASLLSLAIIIYFRGAGGNNAGIKTFA